MSKYAYLDYEGDIILSPPHPSVGDCFVPYAGHPTWKWRGAAVDGGVFTAEGVVEFLRAHKYEVKDAALREALGLDEKDPPAEKKAAVRVGSHTDPLPFTKYDGTKARMDLLHGGALLAMSEVLAYGAEKYAPDNWKRCPEPRRYFAAAQRHLWAWKEGEVEDPESGLNHLAHALTSLMFLFGLTVDVEDDNG